MSSTKPIRVSASFFWDAFRNCGYSPESAIEDIVDNSLEMEVKSENIYVNVVPSKPKGIQAIIISDDGIGMSSEMVEDAIGLGRTDKTTKIRELNLGYYHAGLLGAAASIGTKLEVFSKQECDTTLHYATTSFKEPDDLAEQTMVSFNEYTVDSEEYKWFKENTKVNRGTIVRITEIDAIGTKKTTDEFVGSLRNEMGMVFGQFLLNNVIKIYVNEVLIQPIYLMGNPSTSELLQSGEIKDGENILLKYKVYYLPNELDKNGEDKAVSDKFIVNEEGEKYLSRSTKNMGIWVRRQGRLVGRRLLLGLVNRHNDYSGFRVLIDMDGNSDKVFGTSFRKEITDEVATRTLSDALKDKMLNAFGPCWTECGRRAKTNRKPNKDQKAKKVMEQMCSNVQKEMNKNPMLRGNREQDIKDLPLNFTASEIETEKKRIQKNRLFDKIDYVERLATDTFFTTRIENNERILEINSKHPFYTEFLLNLDKNLLYTATKAIACRELAKQHCNYYGDAKVRAIIDTYDISFSDELIRAIGLNQQ